MQILFNSIINNIKISNITLFSDSIGKGVYFDNELNVKKLDKNLCELLLENNIISINNKSVFGQTLKRVTDKNMIDTYIDNINKKEKNTCIIWLGGNDSDYDWNEVCLNPKASHDSKTNIKEYELMLKETINKLKQNNINVILFNLLPIDSNRYFKNVLCKKYDGEKILEFLHNDLSNLYRHQEEFNNCIVRIAYELDVNLIDVRSIFLRENNFLSLLCNDGIHPNQDGVYYIYNYLINNI